MSEADVLRMLLELVFVASPEGLDGRVRLDVDKLERAITARLELAASRESMLE